MKRFVLVAAVILSASVAASAADYFFPHFFAFKDSTATGAALPAPKACAKVGGVKSIALALDEEQVLQLAYLCMDDTTVIRTDMRPGSGTAVGATSPDIKLHLDAVYGGWAYECGHTIEQVSITLNGQVQDLGSSFYRGQRSDVGAAFGNVCAEMGSSGIGFSVDTSGLAPGTYPMTMRVSDDKSDFSPVSNTLWVTVR